MCIADQRSSKQGECLDGVAETCPPTVKDRTLSELSGTNAKLVYHQVCLRTSKAQGAKIGAAKMWSQVHATFDDLPAATRQEYERIGARNASKKRKGCAAPTTQHLQTIQNADANNSDNGTVRQHQHSSGNGTVRQLQPSQVCQLCNVVGNCHQPFVADGSIKLRHDIDWQTGKPCISKHPLSCNVFCKAMKGGGGIVGLSDKFPRSIVSVGRNMGAVPEKLKALPVCGLTCIRNWKVPIGVSLKSAFINAVASFGGPKAVSSKLPLPS